MDINNQDNLRRIANTAQLGAASNKTRINQLREAKAFVEALRAVGLGISTGHQKTQDQACQRQHRQSRDRRTHASQARPTGTEISISAYKIDMVS